MHHRNTLRNQKQRFADDWLNCPTCMFSDSDKRFYQCGQISSAEWTAESQTCPVPGDGPDDVAVCPGYLIQLPQVHEAARAASWRSEGALGQFYDQPLTQLAKDCIDMVATETKRVEAHAMRKASEKGASNG